MSAWYMGTNMNLLVEYKLVFYFQIDTDCGYIFAYLSNANIF